MAKKKKKAFNPKKYIRNCVKSERPMDDWDFASALEAGAVEQHEEVPPKIDLRAGWWEIDDQKETGACVGFAAACGVLRWHFVIVGKIKPHQKPSARFVWMANKETDELTSYPTTFLEHEGTQTKLALKVIRKYGCVLEEDLPMEGGLSPLRRESFYTKAARLRIASYHNLGVDLHQWRYWLAFQGPILIRMDVDQTWDNAAKTKGVLKEYKADPYRGGHAACLVGYNHKKRYFIVRNSWGTKWGDNGYGYATYEYAQTAFTEAYGAVL